MKQEKYTFQDLLHIMARLRSSEGCPWDQAQTHQSIKKHVVEEAYELVEAIDSKIPEKIADESGDLLLQVVFHAQIGADSGSYSIEDVTDAICRKMIHRHPHIFGDAQDADWDEIKRRDRAQETVTEEMRGISTYLPALMQAEKIQKKAEKAGFYSAPTSSLDIPELTLGARLFSLVGECRDQGVDPELALHRYLGHFISEFKLFEQAKEDHANET